MAVPYPVDERDTQWEQDQANYRVLIIDERDFHSTFDFDDVTLGEVLSWCQDQPGKVFIGLRSRNGLDQLGIIWLATKDSLAAVYSRPTA